jgi:probable HAF family extracellular repeat protein
MKQIFRSGPAALFAGLTLCTCAWAAAPQYRVEQIGPRSTVATDINNRAQVVGFGSFDVSTDNGVESIRSGFLYSQGNLQRITAFGTQPSSALGINERGDIVGGYVLPTSREVAFLYRGGRIIDLGVSGVGSEVNEAGHVIGNSSAGGFFYDGRSSRLLIPNPPGGSSVNATSLNDRDQVSGFILFGDETSRSFLVSGNNVSFLPTLGGNLSSASSINNAGQVVGASSTPDGNQMPFLYENGTIRNLGSLGGDFGAAVDINDRGWIVGQGTYEGSLGEAAGFLYRDNTMYDLNRLVSGAMQAQWIIRAGLDINDRGQILVEAVRRGNDDAGRFSLLLSPVPEMPVYALLAAGLGVVGTAARRRHQPPEPLLA